MRRLRDGPDPERATAEAAPAAAGFRCLGLGGAGTALHVLRAGARGVERRRPHPEETLPDALHLDVRVDRRRAPRSRRAQRTQDQIERTCAQEAVGLTPDENVASLRLEDQPVRPNHPKTSLRSDSVITMPIRAIMMKRSRRQRWAEYAVTAKRGPCTRVPWSHDRAASPEVLVLTEVPATSGDALRFAVKLAVDAGEYERAAARLDVLRRALPCLPETKS